MKSSNEVIFLISGTFDSVQYKKAYKKKKSSDFAAYFQSFVPFDSDTFPHLYQKYSIPFSLHSRAISSNNVCH